LLYIFKRYCICYIICIIDKNKYNLLQYKSAKDLLSIPNILIKIKLILIKISEKLLFVIYTH